MNKKTKKILENILFVLGLIALALLIYGIIRALI